MSEMLYGDEVLTAIAGRSSLVLLYITFLTYTDEHLLAHPPFR
jgi:hypothetical protein